MPGRISEEMSSGDYLEAELIDEADEPAPFLSVRHSGDGLTASANLWLMPDGRIVITPERFGPGDGKDLAVCLPHPEDGR